MSVLVSLIAKPSNSNKDIEQVCHSNTVVNLVSVKCKTKND